MKVNGYYCKSFFYSLFYFSKHVEKTIKNLRAYNYAGEECHSRDSSVRYFRPFQVILVKIRILLNFDFFEIS